jgi:hypothetical protein
MASHGVMGMRAAEKEYGLLACVEKDAYSTVRVLSYASAVL